MRHDCRKYNYCSNLMSENIMQLVIEASMHLQNFKYLKNTNLFLKLIIDNHFEHVISIKSRLNIKLYISSFTIIIMIRLQIFMH